MNTPEPPSDRRPAFVLFGDLPKIGPYLTDLRQRGLEILVVSGPPKSTMESHSAAFLDVPGHPFSAITETRALRGGDHTGILDQLITWSQRYRVVGIFAATEIFVEAAGLATDLLGLPGVTLRASQVCRNKFLQRQYLKDWSPKSRLVTPDSRLEAVEAFRDSFPVVVKPLTLWSSIGVKTFTDAEELSGYLAALPDGDEVLLEERVPGREFNVDAIVVDGEPVYCAITQKGTNEDATRFFAELVHTLPPTNLSDAEAGKVVDTHCEVVRHLGFGTGMAHAEYRVTPEGEVVLMEIAARPPGDGCLHLYHLTTGRPIERALIEAALGHTVRYPEPARRARQVYFEHTPGLLTDVVVEGPDAPEPTWVVDTGIWPPLLPGALDGSPELRQILVLKERDEALADITESGNRAVTAIFDSPLDTDIDAFEKEIRRRVSIHTRADGSSR
ncbi:acetyl-CoA carboxylase biotin carboxylase subunit family protein [Streptomyces sp. NPDC057257]|uniref:ATP-grasp domain-containing protein n=1 Tax=Streptomyces sp. NPDC057257 TaxID=3346071 RepID=UPI0036451CE6